MRIGYIMDVGSSYFRRVLDGVAQFTRTRPDLELRIEQFASPEMPHALDRAGHDGLILGTAWDGSAEAGRLRTPAVSVANANPGLRFPQVVSDDCEVGRMVARYLLAKGYLHFAFWGYTPVQVFAMERWNGFASAIVGVRGEACAPARGEYCVGSRRVATNRRSIGRWMRGLPRPLGLMTANDASGADALDACHDLGLRVPEDVAVIGVDDDDFYAELTDPPLSSVAQQNERIGYLAAETLLRMVAGRKVPQVTLVPPGPLVARQSSNAVATADALVAQAMQFLEKNLARGTNIDELTGALGVSRRSLELRFKAALGRTPGQELMRLKIEQAQGLLATTSLPLKRIATRCGFGNPAQMSHVFRHRTGQTPMGYRRGFSPHEESR